MIKKLLTKIGVLSAEKTVMIPIPAPMVEISFRVPPANEKATVNPPATVEIEEKTITPPAFLQGPPIPQDHFILKEDGNHIKVESNSVILVPPTVPEVIHPVVEFKNVCKSFGERLVLSNVNFRVDDIPNKGELIAIIGQSGCGKSTLLRLIAGLEPHFPQTSGEAFVFGKHLDVAGPDRGVVDQSYSLFPHLTVLKNIAFGLKLRGVSRKDRYALAREWVEKVGLHGNEDKYPGQLSGGMKQRVAIASTLILKPKIILMDEPFGALDPKIRRSAWKLLVDLWKEQESTVFIVTHSMEEAYYLGDRIFRMGTNPGRLVEIVQAPRPDIPAEEMRKQPWFTAAVQELQRRLETDAPPSGELPSHM